MSRRTLAEFEPLLAGLSSGETVSIGGTSVPSAEAGEARQLRGDFVRYLLLGGCDGLKDRGIWVHEKGVRVKGALIKDVLDLEGCRISRDIVLLYCRFERVPVLRSAVIGNLILGGSTLPGLVADRLEAKGSVFLRDVQASGELRLVSARLGGDLSCAGARLTAGLGGVTLHADGLEAKLVSFSGMLADGELRLIGAKLAGDLDCIDARLKTLSANRVRVEGAFFLRGKARITGELDLTGAQFATLDDDAACWPSAGGLLLNRCQYGAITSGPVTAEARIKWLSLQDESQYGQDFWPQPWEQCAKVLREMGHREEARAILIEKEKRQRADQRKGHWFGWRWLRRFADFLMWATVAYGHKPLRAFAWLFALWVIGIGVFGKAEQYDAIKPNDVRILRSAEWFECAPSQPRNQQESHLGCFLRQPEATSYPRFNPAIYSADTLLPIVALEMQSFWIPDDRKGPLGEWARYFLWFQIIMGWGLSLLAVAGFSGLIKSD